MGKAEMCWFAESMKDKIRNCKTIDEKFDQMIDFFCGQTEMMDFILDSLPQEIQDEIEKKAGLDKMSIL